MKTPPPFKTFEDIKRDLMELAQSPDKSVLEKNDQKVGWSNIFDHNLVIGEVHHHLTPKRFLIENMGLLKEKGYNVIFLEHIDQQEYGSDLRSLQNNIFSDKIRDKLSRMDSGFMEHLRDDLKTIYNFTAVVNAAMKHGIEVVGLDVDEENWKKYKSGEYRMGYFNDNARNVILDKGKEYKNNQKKDPKWLCLVGSGHLKTRYGIPGICDIIDVQALLVTDATNDKCDPIVLDDVVKDLYPKKLPVDVSLALTWRPGQSMKYEDIMQSYNSSILSMENSDAKSDSGNEKSDSEKSYDSWDKKRSYKEPQPLENKPMTNPLKKRRIVEKLKSDTQELVLQK